MMQKTLARMLPALVWALTLVALAAALLFALGDASAQQPPISASIVDDNDQNTNSLCSGHVWSDGHCDLRIRITDHNATDSQATIVVSDIYSGAFDASVITPDNTALSSQTLGPTPSTYTIPGNTRQIFRLRMTPVVTASGAQYYQGYVRVHHGAGTNGRKLAEYKLTLQAPTPTSVTSESITSISFAVRWKMDERARRTIIFWRPRDGGSPEQSVQVTMVQNAKYRIISGLQSSTCYVARVQPLLDGKSIESAEIEVATLADPDATDPPVDPCAPPTPPACTTSGDYDVDDDGLIEVCNLQQLDAIRHDLDGDGVPDINPHPPNVPADFTWDGKTEVQSHEDSGLGWTLSTRYARGDFTDSQRKTLYAAAYPNPETSMGCSEGIDPVPTTPCRGYELSANLDFDENGDGLRNDTYNTGSGWVPIMGRTYRSGYNDLLLRFQTGVHYLADTNSPFNVSKMFRAIFEGNGRTISNLYIERPSALYVGLFGYVALSGRISNLGLIDPTIRGHDQVGTLAGIVQHAHVSGSYARNAKVTGRAWVGGLIGFLYGGKVSESYVVGGASGLISGDNGVGGLIGIVNAYGCARSGSYCTLIRAKVTYSFAAIDVSWSGKGGGGGLVGWAISESTIQHTYATGAVTGSSQVPGGLKALGSFVGMLDAWMYVDQSYATGPVVGHTGTPTGGLVAVCLNPLAQSSWHSYWDTETTGQSTSACYRVRNGSKNETRKHTTVGGKTTTELQTPTSATGIYSTWGPVTVDGVSIPVWDFGTNTEYPILAYCAPKPEADLSWDATRTEYCPLREATQHGRLYSASP